MKKILCCFLFPAGLVFLKCGLMKYMQMYTLTKLQSILQSVIGIIMGKGFLMILISTRMKLQLSDLRMMPTLWLSF